jgi:hypothetical protein
MNIYIYTILLLVIIVICFNYVTPCTCDEQHQVEKYDSIDLPSIIESDTSGGLHHQKSDIHLKININENNGYDSFHPGCLSPYCRRSWWWYNNYTPLPWGNSTRVPHWYQSPYNYIRSWYDNYPYYYY